MTSRLLTITVGGEILHYLPQLPYKVVREVTQTSSLLPKCNRRLRSESERRTPTKQETAYDTLGTAVHILATRVLLEDLRPHGTTYEFCSATRKVTGALEPNE